MNKMAIAKLAASTLVVGVTMMGGGMAGMAKAPTISDARSAEHAATAAKQATNALAKQKLEKAILFAEAAVEFQPRDAGYRTLLGQTYLSAGRFQAAEQSFSDALTLEPERERSALNLALTQAALGKKDAARATLADYRDKLPAGDFGLALALAGEPEEAVRILEFATRAPDATAKTRQNLAFAYALAGKWNNAKVMAVQDLPADTADARIAQWAMLVRPAASHDQVAAVLGVKPGSDAGQPVRLALAAPVAATIQVADTTPPPAAPATVVAAVQPQPQPQPAFETAPTQVAEVAQPAPAPFTRVAPAPTPIRQAAVSPSRIKQPHATLRPAVMMRPVATGRYVVQLGAFSTPINAERAWTRISGKFRLGNYDPISGFTKVSNTNLVRLSISGFVTRNDANRVCARIKQGGGVCFVRTQDGDAPAQWVQRNIYKVASR